MSKPLTETQKKILRFIHKEYVPFDSYISRGVWFRDPEQDARVTRRSVHIPYHLWDRLEIAQITVYNPNRQGRRPNLDDPRVAAFIGTL